MARIVVTKNLIAGAWLLAGALFVTSLGAFWWLVANRPTQPVAALGQQYPINNHGTVHYVSHREQLLVDALDIATAIGILGAIAVTAAGKKRV